MRQFLLIFLALTIIFSIGCSKKLVVIKTNSENPSTRQGIGTSQADLEKSDKFLIKAKREFYKGNYKNSLKFCEKAIDANHRNWEAYYYLGLSMQKRRKYELAINTFGTGLKYAPNDNLIKSEMHLAIGQSWENLGHLDNAKKEYELALTLNPDNSYARDARNRIKVHKTMKDWGKKKNKHHDG